MTAYETLPKGNLKCDDSPGAIFDDSPGACAKPQKHEAVAAAQRPCRLVEPLTHTILTHTICCKSASAPLSLQTRSRYGGRTAQLPQSCPGSARELKLAAEAVFASMHLSWQL